ncbi:MAG: hypothetical protein HY608_03555 [Planctomycetes bacterium]|nr:hypothetical protein [Planctomycetota bacterium]
MPSILVLGASGKRPLHVLLGCNADDQTGHVVTVYEPDPSLWEDGFRKRRKR